VYSTQASGGELVVRPTPAPRATEASTNGCSRRLRTALRTSRTTRGVDGITSAMTTFRTLAPVSATNVIASRRSGSAMIPSITRMTPWMIE
jgi:hypothetical protein